MADVYGWGENEPIIDRSSAQGGDTIETYATKVKNALGVTFDTLNTFPWENASQSAAGYMSKTDKKALDDVPSTYLKLAGGTMTGAIVSTALYSLRASDNESQIVILGGSTGSATAGAKLILNGADYENAGRFTLQAGDADGYKQLMGKPDGALTWDGNDVLTSAFWDSNTSALNSQTVADSVTVANNTNVNLASITLTKGTYLVALTASFAENATGYRQIFLSSTASGGPFDRYRGIRLAPCAGAATSMQLFFPLVVSSSSTTYYFNCRQTSGGNLTVSSIGYQYIKLRA